MANVSIFGTMAIIIKESFLMGIDMAKVLYSISMAVVFKGSLEMIKNVDLARKYIMIMLSILAIFKMIYDMVMAKLPMITLYIIKDIGLIMLPCCFKITKIIMMIITMMIIIKLYRIGVKKDKIFYYQIKLTTRK
jgi:hypothetical protein